MFVAKYRIARLGHCFKRHILSWFIFMKKCYHHSFFKSITISSDPIWIPGNPTWGPDLKVEKHWITGFAKVSPKPQRIIFLKASGPNIHLGSLTILTLNLNCLFEPLPSHTFNLFPSRLLAVLHLSTTDSPDCTLLPTPCTAVTVCAH